MGNNTQFFSLANRKQLADMLNDGYEGMRYRAKQRWGTKYDALRQSILNEMAAKKGASAVVRQIESSREKIKEFEAELNALGFHLDDDGDLALFGGSDNPLDAVIDERVEKEIGSRSDIDARFDSVQVAIMTVATREDAEKLMKSVSEL